MILAVVHQKGGVGKTTLALHLAAALSLHGQRCLLIDADPQHSALDWSATRQTEPLFAVVGMHRAVLHRDVPGLSRGYDPVPRPAALLCVVFGHAGGHYIGDRRRAGAQNAADGPTGYAHLTEGHTSDVVGRMNAAIFE